MKSINIKGKEYITVDERVMEFRNKFPNHSLETEIVTMQDGMIVMRAIIKDKDGRIVSTGTAYEKESSSFINKTSYVENCETSAVGRCIGLFGLGILPGSGIASAEEVTNAINNQKENGTFTPPAKLIKKAIPKDVLTKVSLKLEGCETIADLTEAWKECKSEIDTYPEIKTIFTTKKMLLQ